VASARLHAAFLECPTCFGSGQEFNQRLRRLDFLGIYDDATGEHGRLLHVRRQRTDIINTGKVSKLADLLKAELDLAAGN